MGKIEGHIQSFERSVPALTAHTFSNFHVEIFDNFLISKPEV